MITLKNMFGEHKGHEVTIYNSLNARHTHGCVQVVIEGPSYSTQLFAPIRSRLGETETEEIYQACLDLIDDAVDAFDGPQPQLVSYEAMVDDGHQFSKTVVV